MKKIVQIKRMSCKKKQKSKTPKVQTMNLMKSITNLTWWICRETLMVRIHKEHLYLDTIKTNKIYNNNQAVSNSRLPMWELNSKRINRGVVWLARTSNLKTYKINQGGINQLNLQAVGKLRIQISKALNRLKTKVIINNSIFRAWMVEYQIQMIPIS